MTRRQVDSRKNGRSRRAVALIAGLAVVAAACSGTSDSAELTLPPTSTTDSTTATTTAATTTEAPTTSEATGDQAIEVWTQLMELAADRAETDRNDDTIADLTTPDIDDQLNAIFLGEFPRDLTSHAVATNIDGDTTTIHDCIILQPGLTNSSTVWFTGTVQPGPDGQLTVTEFDVETIVGCTPAALTETILADYQTYREARDAYFNPANPDAPELAATTTSEHRELNKGLAQRFLNDNQVLRDNSEIHPEINSYNSPTEVVIVNCQLSDSERGVYDAETGQRTNLIPPIEPDQRDALQVTMRLEDDTWKVADVQAQRDFNCDFAPTELGVPIVPPLEDTP